MRVNKEQLNALLALPDEQLWAEVVKLGSSYGFTLPKNPPPKDQMAKLRATVNTDKIKMSEAVRLLNELKKEGR